MYTQAKYQRHNIILCTASKCRTWVNGEREALGAKGGGGVRMEGNFIKLIVYTVLISAIFANMCPLM